MDKRLLEILCCPLSRVPVRAARRSEIESINRAIVAGGVVNCAGTTVSETYSVALLTTDGERVYRVVDDIPLMLAGEAVTTNQVADFQQAFSS
jgi:uncharacterized protein YbaR (Trm112 family)